MFFGFLKNGVKGLFHGFFSGEILRWAPFLIALLLLLTWGVHSFRVLSPGLADSSDGRKVIEEMIAKIAKTDPQAAEQIRAASQGKK